MPRQPSNSREEIENRFTYHAPKPGQPELYGTIRSKAKEFALYLHDNISNSRELSVALTKLDEVVFWANASIARN
jgi:hypothetical protein